MFTAYKRYFDFQGRSRRKEYWLFALLCILAALPYYYVVSRTQAFTLPMTGLDMVILALYGLFGLASLIPSLSVSVRRLHDSNKSGWLLLLGFIPILGAIVLLVFMILPGTKGPNKFGPDPLAKDEEVFS